MIVLGTAESLPEQPPRDEVEVVGDDVHLERAAIVQGLGLGALALVILSGATWFFSWIYMAPWADSVKEFHKLLTGLIEAYVLGHGGMGMLHLFFQLKDPKNR